MKKIIFTLVFVFSTIVISNAQTNNQVSKDSAAIENKQVEFYSSEEDFLKHNPTFKEDLKAIAINVEEYIHYIILNKVLRRRLIA